MTVVKVYNNNGEVVGDKQLPANVFGVTVKPTVVQQAVVAQQTNARASIAHTKDRSEVSGGGKKPWKQKGTGRARQGSTRSPIWRHGGVTFGPRNTVNWSVKINAKAKNAALRMVLSDKLTNNLITVVDKLELTDHKTKTLQAILKKLPLADKKTLLSLGKKNEAVIKASANLPKVYLLAANSLNVVDLLKYPHLVLTAEGLETVIKMYSPKTKKVQ